MGCSERRCVSRSSAVSGTRHYSLEVDVECVSSAVVGNDCVVLVYGDRVSSGDDVVDADEYCAETIGDDR
jgi:hypothetical protein